jgi:hypothetical protein
MTRGHRSRESRRSLATSDRLDRESALNSAGPGRRGVGCGVVECSVGSQPSTAVVRIDSEHEV